MKPKPGDQLTYEEFTIIIEHLHAERDWLIRLHTNLTRRYGVSRQQLRRLNRLASMIFDVQSDLGRLESGLSIRYEEEDQERRRRESQERMTPTGRWT